MREEKSRKKIILFESDGGELANQLWNYMSLYAYALEKNFELENYSFFEYSHIFKNVQPKSFWIKILFFNSIKKTVKRRYALWSRIWRNLYKILIVKSFRIIYSARIIFSKDIQQTIQYGIYYLAPTQESSLELKELEQDSEPIYFAAVSGGVFRNPLGIKKYHSHIKEKFKPVDSVQKNVEEFLAPLKSRYKHVVGVHIRQGDFKDFKGGKYWIPQERVRQILDEYLTVHHLIKEQTCFVIASDQSINENCFKGLNFVVTKKSIGEDLFILASCEVIIGSESTFGHFASYYGNIPHIVMKNEKMDWEYYKGATSYFQNKYLSLMFY